MQCLVLGAGPCGLRTAIELALLGAQVVLLEKRKSFSRNNVLHLWPYTIRDLRNLAAKKFYGKFCSGSLDHISKCLLFKIYLMSIPHHQIPYSISIIIHLIALYHRHLHIKGELIKVYGEQCTLLTSSSVTALPGERFELGIMF